MSNKAGIDATQDEAESISQESEPRDHVSSQNVQTTDERNQRPSGFDPSQHYTIIRRPQRRSSLQAVSRDFEVLFVDIERNIPHLKEIFESLISTLVADVLSEMNGVSHRVRIVLNAPSLNYPIHIPFQDTSTFNVDLILNELDRVLNSHESFDISSDIKLNLLCISLPSMGGKKIGGIVNRSVPDLYTFLSAKRSVITIKSQNNDCLIRALAVGLAISKASAEDKKQKRWTESIQTAEVKQLLFRLKQFKELKIFQNTGDKLTLEDLSSIAATPVFNNVNITIYDRNFMGVYLKSFNDHKELHVDLLYDRESGHVDVIKSMKGLFSCRFYCYACHKGYSCVKHQCPASGCGLCRQMGCLNRTGYITTAPEFGKRQEFKCAVCGLSLRSQFCLDNHIEKQICLYYFKCPLCNSTIPEHSLTNHVCSQKFCLVCYQQYPKIGSKEHECYVQKPRKRKSTFCTKEVEDNEPQRKLERFQEIEFGEEDGFHEVDVEQRDSPAVDNENIWAFDIETDQSCLNDNEHKPVLLVARNLSGSLEEIYDGYDCIDRFCSEVFLKNSQRVRKYEWFIAHFGSGFDFLPVLQCFYTKQKYVPKIVLRGNKIISLKVGNKRFIDSYLFIPVPLRKFPETFGIAELRKGYFPHYLTSSQSLNNDMTLHDRKKCERGDLCLWTFIRTDDCSHCVGDESRTLEAGNFPPICVFGAKMFSNKKEYEKFKLWHDGQKEKYREEGLRYNFREELLQYCRSDVELLRMGVCKFRQLIAESCFGVDVFKTACTAASACNYIYRRFLCLPTRLQFCLRTAIGLWIEHLFQLTSGSNGEKGKKEVFSLTRLMHPSGCTVQMYFHSRRQISVPVNNQVNKELGSSKLTEFF